MELVDNCSRFFQGTVWRSRTNPEIYTNQLHVQTRGAEGKLVSKRIDHDLESRNNLTVGYRESLETQTQENRKLLGNEYNRQVEQGVLRAEDEPLPPQHRLPLFTPKGGGSRVSQLLPKIPGELNVARPRSAERPVFPLLRTKKEGL